MLASSGIRAGAWKHLDWGHVSPCIVNREVVAAKLVVYAGEPEQYYTFVTPEAYDALKAYMDFRQRAGEDVGPKSPLLRDAFGTMTGHGRGAQPVRLEDQGLKHLFGRAWQRRGMRTERAVRHEFKAIHGFRKWFKTRAEQAMKPINVEILMGHGVGVSSSYYKPLEPELLQDYLKAVPLLSIGDSYRVMDELKERMVSKEALEPIMQRLKELEAEVRALREAREREESA